MYLLLIFALTFTLSTQMKDEDRMLERIMGAIGEEGLAQLMNTLDHDKLDRLMDCLEQECKDKEFVEIMPKVLEIIKGIKSGRAGCSLIKTFIKNGPLYDMVTELREEDMIKAMYVLKAKHIKTLITMNKGKVKLTYLLALGKRILPIIQNAKCGKGVTNLIKTLKNAEQMRSSLSSRRSGRWSNNQGGMQGGAPMPGIQGDGGGRMPGMSGTGGAPMPGMNGAGGDGTMDKQTSGR